MLKDLVQNYFELTERAGSQYARPVWEIFKEQAKEYNQRTNLVPLPFRIPVKSCYEVSQKLIIRYQKAYTYVEGFYLPNGLGFPIPHAWNLDENGQLIDLVDQRYNYEVTAWYGIALSSEFVARKIVSSGYHEPLLNAYLMDQLKVERLIYF